MKRRYFITYVGKRDNELIFGNCGIALKKALHRDYPEAIAEIERESGVPGAIIFFYKFIGITFK